MGKFEGVRESVRVRKYASTAMTGLWHLINKWINIQTFFFPDICDLIVCVPSICYKSLSLLILNPSTKTFEAAYYFHNVINKTSNM